MLSERIVRPILNQFALPVDGPHGLTHWARVLENGNRLAEGLNVNRDVLELFAIFHDSRRICDGPDRNHGLRGADFALICRDVLFTLPDHGMELLYAACAGHDKNDCLHEDLTVRICWDAERLDLYRLGITPLASLMSTSRAKGEHIMALAAAAVNRRIDTSNLFRRPPAHGAQGRAS